MTIGEEFGLLGIIVGGMLVAGLVVIGGRWAQIGKGKPALGVSVIRSWIAVTLVMGLLVFCASALYLPDASTRSTMIGGLIASVGTAVAFYFSSQSADKARSDLLNAAQTLSQGPFAPTTFTAQTPPNGVVNVAYASYSFAANGMPQPSFQLDSGDLPPGLTLSGSGVLAGTPTTAGPYSFVVRAVNSAGHADSSSALVTIAPPAA